MQSKANCPQQGPSLRINRASVALKLATIWPDWFRRPRFTSCLCQSHDHFFNFIMSELSEQSNLLVATFNLCVICWNEWVYTSYVRSIYISRYCTTPFLMGHLAADLPWWSDYINRSWRTLHHLAYLLNTPMKYHACHVQLQQKLCTLVKSVNWFLFLLLWFICLPLVCFIAILCRGDSWCLITLSLFSYWYKVKKQQVFYYRHSKTIEYSIARIRQEPQVYSYVFQCACITWKR